MWSDRSVYHRQGVECVQRKSENTVQYAGEAVSGVGGTRQREERGTQLTSTGREDAIC